MRVSLHVSVLELEPLIVSHP